MRFYTNNKGSLFIREGSDIHPVSVLRPKGEPKGWSKREYPRYLGWERHQSVWNNSQFDSWVRKEGDGIREITQEEFDNILLVKDSITELTI